MLQFLAGSGHSLQRCPSYTEHPTLSTAALDATATPGARRGCGATPNECFDADHAHRGSEYPHHSVASSGTIARQTGPRKNYASHGRRDIFGANSKGLITNKRTVSSLPVPLCMASAAALAAWFGFGPSKIPVPGR